VYRDSGTALGVGERVGNAEMDLLLINLRLLGAHHHDLRRLPEYTSLASRALGVSIPPSYPVVGEDAFRTATGVHAAAIAKAQKKGDAWLADRIYSGVPAGDFGLSQRIDVGHVSGISNVRSWLEAHGYDATNDALCKHLLEAAKRATRTLRDDEMEALIAGYTRQPATA
jgi:2-isopropylmalate synthase